MLWWFLLLVLIALFGAAWWVDRQRRRAGSSGSEVHGTQPESKWFGRYGDHGGGGGPVGGDGAAAVGSDLVASRRAPGNLVRWRPRAFRCAPLG